MRLFVGDDWAEDYDDVELMDERGRVLARGRLPEGVAGMAGLYELIGEQLGEDADDAEVVIGTETDRGPWVSAVVAAGYTVYGVNPLQASRYRERHGVSGAKSDRGDAHMLTDMVRTDSRQLRAVAGDSPDAAAVKVVARTHKTLIWEWEPAGPAAAPPAAGVLPRRAGGLPRPGRPGRAGAAGQGTGPGNGREADPGADIRRLKRAGRRDIPGKATVILAALRSAQLGQPPAVTNAYAATVRSLVAAITVLNEQVKTLQRQVEADFGRHPDAEIYLSQPGLGPVLGARVLGEFGDDPDRYASGKARKNYAGTSPITRASGKRKIVAARFIRNNRLTDALMAQAFNALGASPGARALYDAERARGTEHNPALRKLASRLVGILHRMPQDPHPLRRGTRLAAPGKDPSI